MTLDAGRFFPVDGPRLAGTDVVWSHRGPAGGLRLLRGAPKGAKPRLVFSDPVVNNSVALVEAAEPGSVAPTTVEGLPASPTVAVRQQAISDTELGLRLASDALERAQGGNPDRVIATIPAFWAVDRSGAPVETSVAVAGSMITVQLASTLPTAFPLVAGHEYVSRDAVNEYETLKAAASTGSYAWAGGSSPAPDSVEPQPPPSTRLSC